MAVVMCSGVAGRDRMISISQIPGGNPAARNDPEGYASEWSCCAACQRFTCDRCLPRQRNACACGAPLRLFSEAERLAVARNLAAGRPAVEAASRKLFPLLKPADFAHRALVVSMPLPGRAPARPDLPIVTFAENTPNGYVLLTKADATEPAERTFEPAVARLLADGPRDLAILPDGIAVHAGSDLAAEMLLHTAFVRDVVGAQLKSQDLWVCVPHRVAFYAAPADAPRALAMLGTIVRTELQRGPSLGHAPVSSLAFRVQSGVIVDAVPYEQVLRGPAGRPQADAPRGINWLAGFMGAFFGGVVGMGAGIGVISVFNAPSDMSGTIVLGLATLVGGVGAWLGARSSLS